MALAASFLVACLLLAGLFDALFKPSRGPENETKTAEQTLAAARESARDGKWTIVGELANDVLAARPEDPEARMLLSAATSMVGSSVPPDDTTVTDFLNGAPDPELVVILADAYRRQPAPGSAAGARIERQQSHPSRHPASSRSCRPWCATCAPGCSWTVTRRPPSGRGERNPCRGGRRP